MQLRRRGCALHRQSEGAREVDEGVGRGSARYGFKTQPKNRVLMPQADAVRTVRLCSVVSVASARASRSANSAIARFVRSASASMRIIRDCSTLGNRCLFCSNLEPSSVVSCGIVTTRLAEQRNKVAATRQWFARRAAIAESRRRATATMSPEPEGSFAYFHLVWLAISSVGAVALARAGGPQAE